jgi:ubiquitin-protein ligase
MINVNLHPDGKICLSLLGTHFAGDTTENWQPGISTILQCLLSIRAMILISESLGQNSPVDMGTSPSKMASFDRSVQAQTIWFFMLNWLVDPVKRNGVWNAVINKHFTNRREEILRTVKRWAWQNPDLRNWTGHLAGAGVPKLGQMTEYVPGFHGRRSIDLMEQLENHLPTPNST